MKSKHAWIGTNWQTTNVVYICLEKSKTYDVFFLHFYRFRFSFSLLFKENIFLSEKNWFVFFLTILASANCGQNEQRNRTLHNTGQPTLALKYKFTIQYMCELRQYLIGSMKWDKILIPFTQIVAVLLKQFPTVEGGQEGQQQTSVFVIGHPASIVTLT